ncbi:hypothetical protein [Morganella morganii]|nr:hypothetical protein [Morganella morganii]
MVPVPYNHTERVRTSMPSVFGLASLAIDTAAAAVTALVIFMI